MILDLGSGDLLIYDLLRYAVMAWAFLVPCFLFVLDGIIHNGLE